MDSLEVDKLNVYDKPVEGEDTAFET